jgi:pimeloyl-ACP methyl ester carboxylesterase
LDNNDSRQKIKKKIIKILIGIAGVLILLSLIICVLYLVDKNNRLAELESNSQLAETSAGTIEYKIRGDNGPVILLLHGTPGGCDFDFPMEGYRVLTPSRPGYLRTPLQVGKTPAEQAKAFSALLDTLGIKRVIVFGGSGGGPSAISFAALFPEKTIALVLNVAVSQKITLPEGSTPFFVESSDFFTWIIFSLAKNDKIFNLMINKVASGQEQTTIQLIFKDPQKTKMIKNILLGVWPISRRKEGYINDIKQFRTFDPPVSEVNVPTLIIEGSEDGELVEQSKRAAKLIPGSQLNIIEGGGHLVSFSHYEEFMKIMNQFIQKVTAESQHKEDI